MRQLALFAVTIAAGVLPAQVAERTFAVASIHPMLARGPRNVQVPHCVGDGFVSAGLPLSYVFTFAFDVRAPDIVGEPEWIASVEDGYAIEAKAEGGPIAPAECKRMVAALLRDRFRMRYREEMRESDAFDLIVGPRGHKMRVAGADAPPVRINGSPFGTPAGAPKDYQPPRGMSMPSLASLLVLPVGKPVVDKTSLQGSYTFDIDFAMSPNDLRPDVFSAVQDQLGLKLVPSKTMVKTIVVESIERPSEN